MIKFKYLWHRDYAKVVDIKMPNENKIQFFVSIFIFMQRTKPALVSCCNPSMWSSVALVYDSGEKIIIVAATGLKLLLLLLVLSQRWKCKWLFYSCINVSSYKWLHLPINNNNGSATKRLCNAIACCSFSFWYAWKEEKTGNCVDTTEDFIGYSALCRCISGNRWLRLFWV